MAALFPVILLAGSAHSSVCSGCIAFAESGGSWAAQTGHCVRIILIVMRVPTRHVPANPAGCYDLPPLGDGDGRHQSKRTGQTGPSGKMCVVSSWPKESTQNGLAWMS